MVPNAASARDVTITNDMISLLAAIVVSGGGHPRRRERGTTNSVSAAQSVPLTTAVMFRGGGPRLRKKAPDQFQGCGGRMVCCDSLSFEKPT
jgi:hypothetical protein